MVCGADKLLEHISEGHDYVKLNIRTSDPQDPAYICLDKIEEDEMGGTYRVCDYPEFTRTRCAFAAISTGVSVIPFASFAAVFPVQGRMARISK